MKPIELKELPFKMKTYLGDVSCLEFPKQGCTSDVGIIETNEGLYALKRSKGEQFCAWLSQEAALLKVLANTFLPVPAVHLFIEQTEKNQCWLLMDYLHGETMGQALQKLTGSEQRKNLIYQFGQILRQVHSTPCPGELTHEKPWLDDMLEQSQYNLDHYDVDGSQELLDKLKKNRPAKNKQTLIHGDFTVDNVLVNDGEIVGIIDWSGGAFGDPRYDAALAIRPKPYAFEAEVDKKVFFEGYGERIIDEKEYNYYEGGLYEFF